MAKAYQRPGSRFWWIRYRDPGTGKVVRKSLGIDVVWPDAKRKAEREAIKRRDKELTTPKSNERERWETWAQGFIESRYAGTGSLKNAKLALADLVIYFQEKEIRTPRQVDYNLAADFVPWRVKGSERLDPISYASARLRFVYFGVLMAEAVKRGFCEFNHCLQVRMKRAVSKEKPEITVKDQKKIEKALSKKPEWMQDCWRVLMCQGCRVTEAHVPMERIDTKRKTITFRLKGGKLHTATLHPELIPLVKKARAKGREFLVEGPPIGSWSPIWSDFFKRRELPYSIHCTRVTVITRLARADVPELKAVNFIGHSAAVSRIYRRLKPADSSDLLKSLGGVSIPSSGRRAPKTRGAPQ